MKPSRALQMSTYVAASRASAAWAKRKLAELNERAADTEDASPAIFDITFWCSLALGTVGVALIVRFGWSLALLFTR
ncbi:MAG TPA: hypothetical protein VFP15_13470 [Gemmatimonadaceae bacterium]|nr:hypothetical protein [Gemmatimonadaceae bacterium]